MLREEKCICGTLRVCLVEVKTEKMENKKRKIE